jgi:glycosyltransferase involved in cell wall biosynthesis
MEIVIPHPMSGNSVGGVSRVIQGVTSELGNRHRFRVVTPEPSEMAREVMPNCVDFDSFTKRLPGWGIDYRRPSVKRKLGSGDVIWNNAMMLNDVCAGLETPCVFTFHSDRNDAPIRPLRSVLNLKLYIQHRLAARGVRAANHCERTVCVSRRSRRAITDRVKAGPVVIHNGADFLGSDSTNIDQDFIFWDGGDMCRYVAERVDMQIKGFVPEEAAELENVEKLSEISDEELRNLYRRCSFFVSGSLNDGFGLPPLEANHFGKPAVVYEKEVTNETMKHGENGLVCRNTREIVKAVEKLTEDKEIRQRMGESAFQWAQNFTWEKAAKAYETEFQSVTA